MDLMQFYELLLPPSGNYALWEKATKRHYWCTDIARLAAATANVQDRPDWYFATASFTERRRTQDAVEAKKCLYLDIDAGPAKFKKDPKGVYETNADARRALAEFIKATGLRPSLVLHSGSGLHVYYALDTPVSEGEWKPLAKSLGALAKTHGLRADPACTTDSARVLRPLGSLHSNGKHVTAIVESGCTYSVDSLSSLLPHDPPLPKTERAKLNVNDQLGVWEPAPASAVKAAGKCTALNEIAAVRGDVVEPLWRAMLGVVKFSTEGLDLAQEWSSGHPNYDEGETAEKFDRYAGSGPTTCETFGKLTDACQRCEHRGKVTTPLQLGRLTVDEVERLPEEQKPQPPQLDTTEGSPFGGVRFGEGFRPVRDGKGWHLQGRMAVDKKTEDGPVREYVWVPISDEVLWIDGWVDASSQDDAGASVRLHVRRNSDGRIAVYDIPAKYTANAHDLFKWMAHLAIIRHTVNAGVNSLMHNYITQQFAIAKERLAQYAIRHRFGLQYEHDGPDATFVCAHGKYIIRPDGTIHDAMLLGQTAKHRSAFAIRSLPDSPSGVWPADVWPKYVLPAAKRQVDFYKRHYDKEGFEVAQLALMMSLASPFMMFAADTQLTPGAQLPPCGVTVSLYSRESGRGKTALQRVAASAFGDPARLVISGSNQDATQNAQSKLAAISGTMPFFLDEVTQNSPQDVGALINKIAQGTEKARMDAKASLRELSTWALIATVSTNMPQREMLAAFQKSSDALQMRMLELNCDAFPRRRDGEHVEFERDRNETMAQTYGSLGAVLHMAIVRTGPEKTRSLVQGMFAEAARLVPGSTERERFMQRGMACVLACHAVLERLGLALFDRATLVAEYVRAVNDAMAFSAEIRRTPEDLLRKLVSDYADRIIVTNRDISSSKIEPVLNERQLRGPYVGRRVESTGVLYLSVDAIRSWCTELQVSYTELVRYAGEHGILRTIDGQTFLPKRVTITKSTLLSTVSANCYAINERVLFDDDFGSNVTTLSDRHDPVRQLRAAK